MLAIDLHCHTTASDGTLTPQQLVERAVRDHVDVVAITDHDTVDGVVDGHAAARSSGVRIVGGIELSSSYEERSVHVLGYFIDVTFPELLSRLAEIREDRVTRAHRIVERLNRLGYPIGIADVERHAHGKVLARPHIARALVERGYVKTVREAFSDALIADGGRADVPKRTLDSPEAVRLIAGAGGAAVLAHPGVGHHEGPARTIPVRMLEALRDAGLVGLEADHPDHAPVVRDELHRIADDLDLIPTGGSDFHGEPGQVLGNCRTSPEALSRLEAFARAGG